ncbi:6636_t:CDS:1, partial [Acaulospora morrowiae]
QGRMKIIVSLISNRVSRYIPKFPNFPVCHTKTSKTSGALSLGKKKKLVFDYWIVQICDTGRAETDGFNALRSRSFHRPRVFVMAVYVINYAKKYNLRIVYRGKMSPSQAR